MVKELSGGLDGPGPAKLEAPPGTGTYDGIFDVLAATRRRNVLRYLRETGGPISFDELAAEVVHAEREASDVALDQEKWEDVAVALGHLHLPVMDDANVIEYDEAAETIDVGDRSALAWTQLDAMELEE